MWFFEIRNWLIAQKGKVNRFVREKLMEYFVQLVKIRSYVQRTT